MSLVTPAGLYRPAVYAERALVMAILEGVYPPGVALPAERDLAMRLGVTRPTLREALQRLARDGWVTIRQGKPTRVNDYWREGGLNVLSALVAFGQQLPPNFTHNLLDVRLALAPAYIQAAIAHDAASIADLLVEHTTLDDTPEAFAAFDWRLHQLLTIASNNPVYTLILNGFAGFYEQMACRYFVLPEARAVSRDFYARLLAIAQDGDADGAGQLSLAVMEESIDLWRRANQPPHNE